MEEDLRSAKWYMAKRDAAREKVRKQKVRKEKDNHGRSPPSKRKEKGKPVRDTEWEAAQTTRRIKRYGVVNLKWQSLTFSSCAGTGMMGSAGSGLNASGSTLVMPGREKGKHESRRTTGGTSTVNKGRS